MHRHRAMYNDAYMPYPSLPYRQHGFHMYSPYETMDPFSIPDMNAFAPSPYYDYPYRRGAPPCVDYPYYDYYPRVPLRPPAVQTNFRNDVCYYVDDPTEEYDDEYGNPYRLSRSKVQLVDLAPKNQARRNNNRMVLSTYQPRQRPGQERIVVPRSNVVRNTSLPTYERQRPMRLMPLYHSAEPQYTVPNRRRSHIREIVPVATVANSHAHAHSHGKTIRVRSLSPL